jgi:hypothetical protein
MRLYAPKKIAQDFCRRQILSFLFFVIWSLLGKLLDCIINGEASALNEECLPDFDTLQKPRSAKTIMRPVRLL